MNMLQSTLNMSYTHAV